MIRHRLYHRIYLSLVIAILLTLALVAIVSDHLLGEGVRSPFMSRLTAEAQQICVSLPSSDGSPSELLAALRSSAGRLALDVAVFDAQGALLATTSPGLGKVRWGSLQQNVILTQDGPAHAFRVSGGRYLVVRPLDATKRHFGFAAALAALFVALAVASYPIARRLTRRLEDLEQGVRQLGAGRFEVRVAVQGRDEIARLAASFNWAAARIERLIEAQRRVLASASHELRSPLARLRLALELIREHADPTTERHVNAAVPDIEELDELIEDILLASRLDAQADPGARGVVDLLALLAEEAARVGAKVEAQPTEIVGETRMLRRMIRNLLQNARQHGGGTEIVAGVEPISSGQKGARLWVADRGPGVSVEERERVFEPFYRSSRQHEGVSGAGLGLALVRQIAEHHGGAATCQAREGGGTIFEVRLSPVAPATLALKADAEQGKPRFERQD